MPYVDRDQQLSATNSAMEKVFRHSPGIGGAERIELAEGEIGRTAWTRVLREFRQANAALTALADIELTYAVHAEPLSTAAKAGAVISHAVALLAAEGRSGDRTYIRPPQGFFDENELRTGLTQDLFEVIATHVRRHEVLGKALAEAAALDPFVRHNLAAVIEHTPVLRGTPLATQIAELGGDAQQATTNVASLAGSLAQS